MIPANDDDGDADDDATHQHSKSQLSAPNLLSGQEKFKCTAASSN